MLSPAKVDEFELFCRKGKADVARSNFCSLATKVWL